MWLFMFIILLDISNVLSQPVKSLPGFPGKLPLKLETGYVGVGDVQLFYYFTESERSPKEDPLILWLAGGPGCSALSALVYEIGPFTFNYAKSRSRLLPRLELSPYSWTKVANIIFLDAPVGTGFSYSTTWKGYSSNDTLSSRQTYNFLRKWLIDHPKFRENQLFIGGDSYAGIVVPIIVQEIVNGNEIGRPPLMNLRGYLLGNPATDVHNYLNSRIKFAHRLSLISDEIYESTKRACNGEYVNIDANNTACVKNLEIVSECLDPIYRENILEPICHVYCPGPTLRKWNRSILEEHNIDFNVSLHELPEEWCRDQHYILSYLWANDKSVQKALHVREDTITQWVRCNKSLSYTKNIWSSVDYHKNLTKKNIRSLIYSGDHDLVVPFIATAAWIKSLNLSIEVAWRPWFVDGQVAGYTVDNENYNYWLTFATVKGGGHTAPEFKPKQCLAMVARWLAIYPL